MPSVAKQNNPDAEAAERDEIEQQAIALGVKPPLLQWLKTCDLTTANAFIDELLKTDPPPPGPPKDGSAASAMKAAAAQMAHVIRASTRTAIAERRRAAREGLGLQGRDLEDLERAMGIFPTQGGAPARREATRLVLSSRTPTQLRADKENRK